MTWQLASFLILGVALALGFAWYERSRPPARVLALVAALAALAVVGRLAFAPLPNVKPTTDIVLFAGYALGGAPGFAVGAVTALVSNVFLSHGPWTPWQMAAWGGIGVAGGALGTLVRGRWRRAGRTEVEGEPRELGRWPLALACGLAGLGFGVVMDLYLWTLGAEQTGASYVAIAARSLPFNIAHIVGNVVFCLLIGPPLVRALRRYRRRFEVRWAAPGPVAGAAVSRRAPVACATLALVVAAGLTGPPAAEADSATERATRYLLGSQNCDGGFASGRGGSSVQSYTAEAAFGLAAAGWNPRDVKGGSRSAIDHVKGGVGSLTSTSEISRTILLVRAAKLSPRRFAGRNLRAELVRRRRDNGSFDDGVAFTAFAVLALRASGDSASSLRGSASWLAGRQNDDGGFSLARGAASDADLTGAVLEALAAANDPEGAPARRDAIDYLSDDAQRPGGGFGQTRTSAPNAQSTAYAVQGLVAAGRGGGATVRDALLYLRRLQAPDGSIRKSETSGATPVWVTGQALAALRKKPFPLDPVERRRPKPNGDCVKEAGDGEDGKKARAEAPREGTARPPRRGSPARRPNSGGRGGGSAAGVRAGPGAAGPAGALGSAGVPGFPIGSTATPFAAPPFSIPGPSGSIGAAGALATPLGALPGLPAGKPKTPGQLFSDAPGGRSTPVAASKPLGSKKDNPAPRIGAGALLVVLVAGGLLLATGGGARLRRLWASARRRTS